MEREEVFEIINHERKYQIKKWDSGLRTDMVPDSEKDVAEWLNYIEFCLNEAKKSVYHLDKDEALSNVRKIATLGVACMEIHGCPDRKV